MNPLRTTQGRLKQLGCWWIAAVIAVSSPAATLRFDGVTGQVNIGSSTVLKISGNTGTWEAWINPAEPTAGSTVFMNREGEYEFGLLANGNLWWAIANTSPGWVGQDTGVFVPLNQWMHVTFVYDGSTMTLYTNGVSAGSQAASGNIGDAVGAQNDYRIGARQAGPSAFFRGQIDEVRVWNIARSGPEVAAWMNRPLAGNEAGLLAYYRLQEGLGTVTADSGASQLFGALSGGVVWNRAFDPLPGPIVEALPAGTVSGTNAQLNTLINTNRLATTNFFRWGPGSTALSFDGANDEVMVPHDTALNTYPLTLTAWVRVEPGAGGGIMNKYSGTANGWRMLVGAGRVRAVYFKDSNNRLAGNTPGSSEVVTAQIDDGQWHHVAFTVDASGGKVYVDGTLSGSAPWVGTPGQATINAPVEIGLSAGTFLKGQVDDAAVWNTALDATAIGSLIAAGQTTGHAQYSNVVAHWDMDAGSGTNVPDVSGHGHEGTFVSLPVWRPEMRPILVNQTGPQTVTGTNRVLDLNGVNNHVDVPDGIWFDGDFTVEFKTYIRRYTPYASFLDFGNGAPRDNVLVALDEQNPGRLKLWSYRGVLISSVGADLPVPLNQWVHLAVTLQGSTATLYQNGAVIARGTVLVPAGVLRTNTFIGRPNWVSDTYADALMDDVRIWNTARSGDQIRQFMDQPVDPADSALLLNYRFDESSGTTAVDSRVSSPQNGTLANGAGRLPQSSANAALAGLSPGRVYHAQPFASFTNGVTPGIIRSFATSASGGGTALWFDGLKDVVAANNPGLPTGNSPYTIEAWIKPDEMNSGGIVGWGNYGVLNQVNAFRLTADGLHNYWWNNDLTANNVTLTDRWHHVAATFDGTLRRIVVDGVERAAGPVSGTHNVIRTDNFTIGRTYTAEYFKGQIDEVRIWNVGRTVTELQQNMNVRLNGDESGLVAYYRVDEGDGPLLQDATPNHSSALIVGTPQRIGSGAAVSIPVAVTQPATGVALGNATLNGTVNGEGTESAFYWFEFGPGTNLSSSSPIQSFPAGITVESAAATLTNLQAGQTYSFQLVAANSKGTNYGGVRILVMPFPSSGYALQFDGTNYVNLGSSTALKASTALTAEAWIYPTGPGDPTFGGIILNKEGEYEFARFADGTLRWALAITSPAWVWVNTGIVAPTNRWLHVAFTYDKSNVRLYTNGVLASTIAATGNIGDVNTSLNELWIGQRQGGGQGFQGLIDEVRLWGVTRSASDVAANYNRLLTGTEPGLLAWLRFDEGSGNTTVDYGPNHFAGTLVNNPTFVASGAEPTTPLVATLPPSPVQALTATLRGSMNAGGIDGAVAYFEFGLTVAYGNATAPGGYPASLDFVPLSAAISGLDPGTTYHYRAVAYNSSRTNYGADQTFTTLVLGSGWPVSTKLTGGEASAPVHVLDGAGGTVLAGVFSGSATFRSSLVVEGGATANAFVGKLSDKADWAWAVNIPAGTNGFTLVKALAVDSQRNVYVAGQFSGTNTFGATQLVSNGDTNLFVAKLDSFGTNWLWARAVGSVGIDSANAIGVLGTNVFVAGQFAGTADFTVTNLTAAGANAAFVAGLDTDGNWLWARSSGGAVSAVATTLATDTSTNVYVAGQYTGTATFGATTLTNAGGSDIFVAQLSPSGAWGLVRRGGSANNDAAAALIRAPGNQFYLTGQFGGTADYGGTVNNLNVGNSTNIFVLKLNADALYIDYAQGGSGAARSITVDSQGRVYLTGDFTFTTAFGTNALISSGNRDAFIAQLVDGDWVWAQKIGSAGDETAGTISADIDDSVVISGTYQGTIQVGFVALSTPNNRDIFVARLGADRVYEHNNYIVGEAVAVPVDAQDPAYTNGAIAQPLITILEKDQPDSSGQNSFVWSLAEHKLYPVRQVTAILKWPLTTNPTNTTSVVTAVGRSRYPTNPVIHVANAPADLEPQAPGFTLKFLGLSFSTINGVSVDPTTKQFTAPSPGWSVLQFLVTGGALPDPLVHPSRFEVVRTVAWNDPLYLTNEPAVIGAALTRMTHDDPTGKNGFVYFANSFYDGAGVDRAYDRLTRTGPIIPVNKDTASTNDDLVVVWYHVSANGIPWPGEPVRYLADWPTDPDELVLASRLGSGDLNPADYPSKRVYNQPDKNLPGFNPNEEHAALYGDTLYALRNDLNNAISPRASDPYTLLKYLDPATGDWTMKVYRVVTTNATFPLVYNGAAGDPLVLPEPLSFLGLCSLSNRVVAGPGFQDYAGQLYARAAGPGNSGTNIVARYWYPLQADFFYDLNLDGTPDAPIGTCIPWLDRRPGGIVGTPVDVAYNVTWPAGVPTLEVGESLLNAKFDLPDLRRFASANLVYDQGNPFDTNAPGSLVRLFDPLSERTVQLATNFVLSSEVQTANDAGRLVFTQLPYALRSRLRYDDLAKRLSFGGLLDESVDYGGRDNPLLLINVLSPRERDRIKQLTTDPPFLTAIDDLYDLTRNPNRLDADRDGQPDKALLIGLTYGYGTNQATGVIATNIVPETLGAIPKVLTAGPGTGSGYVTVVENNDPTLSGLPVTLHVIQIADGPFRGDIKVLYPDDVFDQKLTLRHSADFGGEPQRFEFEWYYVPDDPALDHTSLPVMDAAGNITDQGDWIKYPGVPSGTNGYNDITVGDGGTGGLLTLADNWFICRYRGYAIDGQTNWSDWVGVIGGGQAQLAEGWVKRVLFGLNPFEARTDSFHDNETVTYASMLQQAGPRYEGDIAFNPGAANLNSIGLIQAYETVLRRAESLSVNAVPGINYAPANNALLLAAGRISDLYMLVGNEAFADAADPTIGFRTDSAGYGTLAPSIFTFQNQLDSLLEEELVLLRGRDDHSATVKSPPVYNRLFWNFTHDDGEVAYAQAYNITDQNKDGFINADDARIMYPQGHGDAWGHYLTAVKEYYGLLQNTNFDWIPRSESILLAGVPVEVDYLDERKFARAAAVKAKTGAQIVDLTYRLNYVDDPAGQFQGYKDTDPARAWGLSEWGHRAGSGALFDWITANTILPATDPNTNHVGIEKIDRTTVPELDEIIAGFESIQEQLDKADAGLNPLGLAKGVVPFDIDPSQIDAGKTHFEQIYDRAVSDINNAVSVFNHANQLSQSLRALQDSVTDFSRNVDQQERDYKNRLIEIFGYPYAGDIGTGRTYPPNYNGPDIYHYMYVNTVELNGDTAPPAPAFTGYFTRLEGAFHFFEDDLPTLPNTNLLTDGVLPISYPLSTADFGFVAPSAWGQRRAPGEVQMALSDLVQSEARAKQAVLAYENLLAEIDDAIDLLESRYDVRAESVTVRDTLKTKNFRLSVLIGGSKITRGVLDAVKDSIKETSDVALESIPKVVGTATDATSVIRGTIKATSNWTTKGLAIAAGALEISEGVMEAAKESNKDEAQFEIDTQNYNFEVQQRLKALEQLIRKESVQRAEVFGWNEKVSQNAGRYQAALARGLRLIDERTAFRKNAAADTQASRYQDMTFRIFRNDAIQKYRAQFDLAAQYVFLAATAYDYETELLGTQSGSGRAFLTDIIRQRSLGQINGGVPVAGQKGLADPLGRLGQNFAVLKGQLGFNNPQTETGRFSLRNELFRLRDSSDANWHAELKKRVVANLWDVPEFRRYCRPFAPESAGPQPGLVIRFPTTVTFGLNYFSWPLGGGDNSYDSTVFATKVRSAGVWFENYLGSGLSLTPRVYLVPAGADVMRSPSGNLETRSWRVVDQKIPVPFPIGASSLTDPTWIPMNDSLSDQFAAIRRYSSFRAYHDSGVFDPAETISDSRLIGRSVWNTDWMLIIPGGTFLNDPSQGLDTFISTVGDIKIFYQTYSFSGD